MKKERITKEETDLLFQDLCGRLRSGLICSIYREDDEGFGWRDAECKGYFQNNDSYEFYFEDIIAVDNIEKLKPYLRPLSSMTDEEEEEYDTFFNTDYGYMDASKVFDVSDWMYAHHFDYRGLIPMGLALEAPEGMYKKETIC